MFAAIKIKCKTHTHKILWASPLQKEKSDFEQTITTNGLILQYHFENYGNSPNITRNFKLWRWGELIATLIRSILLILKCSLQYQNEKIN